MYEHIYVQASCIYMSVVDDFFRIDWTFFFFFDFEVWNGTLSAPYLQAPER